MHAFFCLRDEVLLQVSVAPPKFGANCLTHFLASLSEFNLALSHYDSNGGDVIREDHAGTEMEYRLTAHLPMSDSVYITGECPNVACI